MKNSDLPAMPHTTWDNDVDKVIDQGNGLTKREYFAGLAMQGLLTLGTEQDRPQYARASVRMADALLAELEKPQ